MVLTNLVLPNSTIDNKVEVLGKLDDLESVTFEPVGRWYESYCSRFHHKHSLSTSSQSSNSGEEEVTDSNEFEYDDSILLTLDPKNWKDQDHYALLGLGKLRYKATESQIKKAYRRQVLLHHPDKKKQRGIVVEDSEKDNFTCIQKGYELLLNPTKRRSYDSVDPQFDEFIPSNNANSKQNFYKVFGPVFESNVRWSIKTKDIPSFGDENTPFENVDSFYDFWYNFESWREFSYLDEEEKEGENREERRWVEKQNKASKLKRKKEESQRIRQLVDTAFACDPRISKHINDEKERKIAEKKAKQDAIRFKLEEEERIKAEALEAERLAKKKEDEELKAQEAVQKKEKEHLKNRLKKEKKRLRTYAKDCDFLATNDKERIQNMQDFEKIYETSSVESLVKLNEAAATGDKITFYDAFQTKLVELHGKMAEEKRLHIEAVQKTFRAEAGQATAAKDEWSEQEIQTLIKAVNLFPAGTNSRWETIANFLKLHVPHCKKNAKEALAKAKDLQKNDNSLKEDANKKAFENFAKEAKAAPTAPVQEVSERYESAAEVQVYDLGSNPAPWTPEEQKLLEQAMRTYPASIVDRWDKIAESIPMRTKKDCMVRYKELVELIRTKKLAQAATKK